MLTGVDFVLLKCAADAPVRLRTGWPLVASLIGGGVDRQWLCQWGRWRSVRWYVWGQMWCSIQQRLVTWQTHIDHYSQLPAKCIINMKLITPITIELNHLFYRPLITEKKSIENYTDECIRIRLGLVFSVRKNAAAMTGTFCNRAWY